MDSDTNTQERGDATVAFERALERVVLESFTKGVRVAGTWNITVPVTDAPDWTITIKKSYSREAPAYDPSLLEE